MTPAAPPPLSAAEIEDLIRGFSDHERFCGHLKIRNKDGIPVPYRTSQAGLKLNRAIQQQEQAGQPIRVCCLKASQVWMSSSAATQIFRRVPFFPGRRALVLADIQAHSDLVFDYYLQYIKSYQDNPFGAEWQSAIKLPELERENLAAGNKVLKWANDSSILVGTANNVDIGRSAPYNWAHLSEAAFYRDMSSLMRGLMQRIPNSPDSGAIVESTANGIGGAFYDLCQLALSRKSGWLFVFFAWWEHPEYVATPQALGYKDMLAFQRTLAPEEITEQQRYRLTMQQLAWRRRQIETACEGKVDRFHQEFPANPQEAFQASGRTIFDMKALAAMPVIQEPNYGRLEVIDVGIEKRVQFIQDDHGDLAVFKLPELGHEYVMGIDHAEGIDPTAKAGTSDPDYCSATVLDAGSGEQVAKMRERYEPRPWAQRVRWLGQWYNWAFCCPEQKAVGKAVIGHLLELGYPVELIYAPKRDPSDRRTPLLQELGYDTNTVFRPILVSALDTAIRERAIAIHDPGTLAECQSFVRKANGREEGQGHDDDVFSVALAVVALADARRTFQYRRQRDQATHASMKPVRYGQRRTDEDD